MTNEWVYRGTSKGSLSPYPGVESVVLIPPLQSCDLTTTGVVGLGLWGGDPAGSDTPGTRPPADAGSVGSGPARANAQYCTARLLNAVVCAAHAGSITLVASGPGRQVGSAGGARSPRRKGARERQSTRGMR